MSPIVLQFIAATVVQGLVGWFIYKLGYNRGWAVGWRKRDDIANKARGN